MSLLGRIVGVDEPKLKVHQFWASMAEWGGGYVTRADVIAAHGIIPADEGQLDFVQTRWVASIDKKAFEHELHRILVLAESAMHGYEVQAALQARIIAIP